jgi:NAD(P)H-dependent flavin oxidoreductase YrpB (nitropropane dioxygenase family)
MRTSVCDLLSIDLPIFAFSHCRDVVAAVSKGGGFGVLGAAYFTAEQLEIELDWLDANVGTKSYGVDIILPERDVSAAASDTASLTQQLRARIPIEHRDFINTLLNAHGVPEWPDPNDEPGLLGWTAATVMPLLEASLKRDKCRLIANALGAPPRDLVARIHASGRLVAGLCGRVSHADKHQQAGVDLLVAVGSEGGGHVGEVGSVVLWPQVVDAVAPLPVLAAGGIGTGRQIAAALACGAQGVWTGSLWLTAAESSLQPAQRQSYLDAGSEDTIRTRSWTGKPSRMLRNAWTDAWAAADAPPNLGMPVQGLATADAMRRVERYAGVADAQAVACNPAGQVIGQIGEIESCRQVMQRLMDEYLDAIQRLPGCA